MHAHSIIHATSTLATHEIPVCVRRTWHARPIYSPATLCVEFIRIDRAAVARAGDDSGGPRAKVWVEEEVNLPLNAGVFFR